MPERERWFREEVQPHEGLLKRWLRGRFPKVRDVDDLVHDSYVRLWQRHAVRPIESAKSFLFVVARNLAIDRTIATRASPLVESADLEALEVCGDGAGSEETACRREEVELIMQAIETLSPRTREVYILRQLERVPQKEIAARLGISVNTVEVHISRANKVCVRYLRNRGLLGGRES